MCPVILLPGSLFLGVLCGCCALLWAAILNAPLGWCAAKRTFPAFPAGPPNHQYLPALLILNLAAPILNPPESLLPEINSSIEIARKESFIKEKNSYSCVILIYALVSIYLD